MNSNDINKVEKIFSLVDKHFHVYENAKSFNIFTEHRRNLPVGTHNYMEFYYGPALMGYCLYNWCLDQAFEVWDVDVIAGLYDYNNMIKYDIQDVNDFYTSAKNLQLEAYHVLNELAETNGLIKKVYVNDGKGNFDRGMLPKRPIFDLRLIDPDALVKRYVLKESIAYEAMYHHPLRYDNFIPTDTHYLASKFYYEPDEPYLVVYRRAIFFVMRYQFYLGSDRSINYMHKIENIEDALRFLMTKPWTETLFTSFNGRKHIPEMIELKHGETPRDVPEIFGFAGKTFGLKIYYDYRRSPGNKIIDDRLSHVMKTVFSVMISTYNTKAIPMKDKGSEAYKDLGTLDDKFMGALDLVMDYAIGRHGLDLFHPIIVRKIEDEEDPYLQEQGIKLFERIRDCSESESIILHNKISQIKVSSRNYLESVISVVNQSY